jgi:two-component system, cell cycle response regulator CpdR
MARVLLAETNQRIGDFIAGILAEFGHEVTRCTDASEAGIRLAAGPIDVLLTDLLLPDGGDAGLGQDWQSLDIPTVTLTGRTLFDGPALPAPPPLIDKPFRFADLRRVLDAVAACTASDEARQPEIRKAA